MHKEERIKVLGKKIQLLEGVKADKKEVRMGEGEKVEGEKVEGRRWRGRKGKQAQVVTLSQRTGS